MYSFIVLGLIPGTNIQISFELWLQIVAGLTTYILLSIFAVWTYRFFRLTNQLLAPAKTRLPLYASQLHQRVQ